MIAFKKLRWKNLLSTGNAFTEIKLDKSPTTLIVGENGAGKTSCLDALSYVLFGKPFRKINRPNLVNSVNQKGLLVEIEFTIGKSNYLIRRGMLPSIFEIIQDGKLINQDASARDYQQYLEKNILKLNHKSFCQIVVIGGSSFVPFMQLPTPQRREIIEDLLDLQVFSTMNIILKQRVLDNKNEITDTKYQIDLVEDKIETQEKYLLDIQKNNDKIIEDNEKKISDNRESIRSLELDIKDLELEITKQKDLITDKNSVSSKLNTISDLQKRLKEKIGKLKKDIEFFEQNEICPTCKQDIEHDFRHETREEKSKQLEETKNGIESLEKEYKKVSVRLEEISEVVEHINQLNSSITEYNSRISALNKFISKVQEEIDSFSKEARDNKEDQKKLTQLNKEKVQLGKRKDQLIKDKNTLDIAAILLKDGGIKSKIIKQYVPIMNKLINKYLAALDFFVEFELDENFEEKIKSRYRDEFSYSSFSEGEKMRINLALLFCWRAITKLRSNSSINVLIIDEALDGSLDTEGVEHFIKLIKELENTNTFIITHKDDLYVDKFSSTIKFEKSGNFSRIKED